MATSTSLTAAPGAFTYGTIGTGHRNTAVASEWLRPGYLLHLRGFARATALLVCAIRLSRATSSTTPSARGAGVAPGLYPAPLLSLLASRQGLRRAGIGSTSSGTTGVQTLATSAPWMAASCVLVLAAIRRVAAWWVARPSSHRVPGSARMPGLGSSRSGSRSRSGSAGPGAGEEAGSTEGGGGVTPALPPVPGCVSAARLQARRSSAGGALRRRRPGASPGDCPLCGVHWASAAGGKAGAATPAGITGCLDCLR